MPDAATGAALTGAASGAAAGTAVFPGVGTLIGAGVGALGGYLSASGTSDAQSKANAQAGQAAASQSAQAFANYLSSRGISIQAIAAAHPEYYVEWQRSRDQDRNPADFQTWFYNILRNNPNDPLWVEINSGKVGAQNTTLPNYATDANGNPIQPGLAQAGIAIGTGQTNPATAPISSLATVANVAALFAANPSIKAEIVNNMAGSSDTRTPEEWLVAHITQGEQGQGTFSTLLRNFAVAQATGGNTNVVGAPAPGGGVQPATTTPPASTLPGPAGTGNNTTLDPGIAKLIPNSTDVLGKVFDGTYLTQLQGAQAPIDAARTAGAAAQLAKINELRGLSGGLLDTELGGIKGVLDARTAGAGGIFDASVGAAGGVRDAATAAAKAVNDANVTKLAALLGVRREAAQAIYDASATGAGGVRDARTTGAKGIYDAERLQADTYAQSAEQALSRVLAQQGAERARQGFTGGSSGSDILRARTMAGAIQQGAGARAQAGVNYSSRLSDAGVGYAGDIRTAGVGRATTIGQANEADAQAQLQAAVDLARSLGLAGTNYATSVGNAGIGKATTLAGAGEQDAIAQLQAKVADATRRLGYLTSDADIAKANADLQNAQDALGLIAKNQQTQIGAIGAPFSLAGMDLGLKGNLSAQQYTDLTNLNKYLDYFKIAPASGPQVTTSTPGPVLNPSQVAGGAIIGANNAIGTSGWDAFYKQINDILASKPTTTGAPTTTTPDAGPAGSILSPSTFLGKSSVFNTDPNGYSTMPITSVTNPDGSVTYKPCWIARAVYGESNPKWLRFRDWLLTRAPDWFREFYLRNGERIAANIRGNVAACDEIRRHFDAILATA